MHFVHFTVLLFLLQSAAADEMFQCGQKSSSSSRREREISELIVNGAVSRKNDWPWMVQITVNRDENRRILCGGSIIDKYWILTAAHCLDFARIKDVKKYDVFVGIHDSNKYNADEGRTLLNLTSITVHPDYKLAPHPVHDLALMYFEDGIPFNSQIQPVCLPCNDMPVGSQGFLTGWGTYRDSTLWAQTLLHEVLLPVVDSKNCKHLWYNENVTETILCTEVVDGKDSCYGDAGGPFVFKTQGVWELKGVAGLVTEKSCGINGAYSIFTKVDSYLPWIEDTMDAKCDDI